MNRVISEIGVFGLGVMGSALSLNLADNNFKVSVFNRDEGDEKGIVDRFLKSNQDYDNLFGFTEIQKFVESIERPRKIIVMIAASAVDTVLDTLLPILDPGDIVLDTGNSHYKESKRRIEHCTNYQVEFLGVGVSGGEKGARYGPSIMPGGSMIAYEEVKSYLEAIAAKDKSNTPCVSLVGPEGAGHFVKMVHNGIEYVEMQLLAELYQLLRIQYSNEEIARILSDWNKGTLHSFLLDITSKIFLKNDGKEYLIDQILDKAGSKGTGSWSTISGLQLGTDNSMMGAAVFARYLSSQKDLRTILGKKLEIERKSISMDIMQLKVAYELARRINHLQGFDLLLKASEEFNWDFNYSEITRIWTNGCIIRSDLMEELRERFKSTKSLFHDSKFIVDIKDREMSLASLLNSAIHQRVATPAFSSAWNYWAGCTTANGPANLIQAQRDYFGSHTYNRKDDPTGKSYHTIWEE